MSHALHLTQLPRRAPILGFIVLFHAAFLYLIATSIHIELPRPQTPIDLFNIPSEKPVPKQSATQDGQLGHVSTPVPSVPVPEVGPIDEEQAPTRFVETEIPVGLPIAVAEPVVVEPEMDPRHPITIPPYPPVAIRNDWEGLVIVEACVNPSGRIADVGLKVSSGIRVLDEAALKHLAKPGTRMLPGTRDGRPVTACTDIPVRFEIERR